MSARFLLIDGYNLMHAAGMARLQYGPGDLQRCRERLLRYLATHLSPAETARALVIFDAREPPPDRPSRLIVHGMTVLFANPGGDADVALQEALAEHPAPRRVTLVSSDHALQQAARRHRADYVDSEDFISTLAERRRRGPAAPSSDANEKPSDQLTAAEAEHWSCYFGDLSNLLTTEERGAEESGPKQSPEQDVHPSRDTGQHLASTHSRQQRRRSRRSPEPAQKESSKGVGDIDFWMQVFRGLPEADELAAQGDRAADLENWFSDRKDNQPPRKRTD